MEFSGCSFVRDWDKGTSMIHQTFCIKIMIERSNVSTKSHIPASTSHDFRPRETLEGKFELPYRPLTRALIGVTNMTRPDIINPVR